MGPPAYLKTAVPIRSLCLRNLTEDAAPSALDYTAAWDSMIHVAFYDTRTRPRLYDMRMAAAVFNTSSVFFHVLLAHPRPVPGMRVTDISSLPPLASCLHRNLKRSVVLAVAAALAPTLVLTLTLTLTLTLNLLLTLTRLAHGPGPQYLMKPLLHWALPRQVCGGASYSTLT